MLGNPTHCCVLDMVRIDLIRMAAFSIVVLMTSPASAGSLSDDCSGNHSDHDRRIRACTQLIEQPGASNVRLTVAYYNRGRSYRQLGEYDNAIADFDKAIELYPEYARAYNNRGIAYASKGRYTRSIVNFDKAIELKPKRADYYFNRALTYNFLGDKKQAKVDIRISLYLDPSDKSARNLLERLEASGTIPTSQAEGADSDPSYGERKLRWKWKDG